MITVSGLYTYPVKSLGGIALTAAELTERGFKYDRRWMLVDENNTFLTQREFPVMALLKVNLLEDALSISYEAQPGASLQVNLEPESTEFTRVQIWSNNCKAQLVSAAADQWFSDILGSKCRLVYMPEDSRRRVDERYAKNKEITSFTDACPFLMIGQASLDDCNSRLDEPVPMERFRPNIVFTGGAPYEEDNYKHFSIGSVEFFGIKRCGRCMITTIDQQSGFKGVEPLKTLATYRSSQKNVYFGNYLSHRGEGKISVGEEIKLFENDQGQ